MLPAPHSLPSRWSLRWAERGSCHGNWQMPQISGLSGTYKQIRAPGSPDTRKTRMTRTTSGLWGSEGAPCTRDSEEGD